MTKEKAIKDIMKDLDCTEEEAEEVFQMEEKARKNGSAKMYGESSRPRKKVNREKKIDEDKRYLIQLLQTALENDLLNFKVVNDEREITFDFKDNNYSVVLTKHRPKKNEG